MSTVKKLNETTYEVQVTKSGEEFKHFKEHIFKHFKDAKVDGFRPGKVPTSVIEKTFKNEINEQMLNHIISDAYKNAVSENNLKPIADIKLDKFEIKDDSLEVVFTIPVLPEIKLGDYKSIKIEKESVQVTDENVNEEIEKIRINAGKLKELESDEAAELNDVTNIDFEGFIDGEAFEGGQGNDYPLELGSNTFIPGFEDQLVGLKLGESKDVQVTFPEDYHAEDLAGKEAIFKVEIKKIETRKMRDLNDEFAQEVSSFDSLAELREDIKSNLEKMTEKRKRDLINQEVLAQALEKCDIPAADAVVNAQLDRMLEQFGQRMAAQGLSLEQYFQFTGSNPEAFYSELRPEAERIVKTNFMLEKIVEEKGFTITDEEIDNEIEKMAKDMGLELEIARERLNDLRDQLQENMKIDKAIEYLVDNAVITEKEDEEKTEEVNKVETDE